MQKRFEIPDFLEITPDAPIATSQHGGRAKCLQRLIRLGLPVPKTVALSFASVRGLAAGSLPDLRAILSIFETDGLFSVRPSSEDPDWGGPSAILNIGMNDHRHAELTERIGANAADVLYLRFIRAFAVEVARLDPDVFEMGEDASIPALLAAYEVETDAPFPQDATAQLSEVLRSMARAWDGTTARLLRQAKGAPADAGLGLVVQSMALGVGPGESGSGVIQFVDSATGQGQITGRYLGQSQGRDAIGAGAGALYLTNDPRGPSLEEHAPKIFDALVAAGASCRTRLREEMQIEFAVENGRLAVLDAVRVQRSARADVEIAVALAQDGVLTNDEAVLRVTPGALPELLHRHVNPRAKRDVFVKGIGASPGAATGRLAFSSRAAQAAAAQGDACILVRRETTPEDVRGMHSAAGVLTERGGMSSHAAVIARGLGVPCLVGANTMRLDRRAKTLTSPDGRVFREGDVVTLDGARGEALAGEVQLLEPALGEAFQTLLGWADEARDIGVRANADTPAEAEVARRFMAEGIGLARTEHMFLDEDRLTVMREMIFADGPEARAAVLKRLLPMQRQDFAGLFEIMAGLPVCIRLFDPPLHEFLPTTHDAIVELANALDLSVTTVTRRIEALSEFNPMLGMRGVRLGITIPEIYEMQARAIFEAVVDTGDAGTTVVPEIMIPLVSAMREVELVTGRIHAEAARVRAERAVDFNYKLGVMVETPRAALRADEIANHAEFLSFGTNDLTQMAYGLSRDDAGRFMRTYVAEGVFPEDPFHRLDVEGVGELLTIGAERGRRARPEVVLSICGEHGGDPTSIAFCREAGFDYVSCSPFRVPVARLAAAHLAIQGRLTPDHGAN
ncbi:MAG: putative PEP-binding protein [Pseudomonadota bacterium]